MFESISLSHPDSFFWTYEHVISYYVRDSPLANKLASYMFRFVMI